LDQGRISYEARDICRSAHQLDYLWMWLVNLCDHSDVEKINRGSRSEESTVVDLGVVQSDGPLKCKLTIAGSWILSGVPSWDAQWAAWRESRKVDEARSTRWMVAGWHLAESDR